MLYPAWAVRFALFFFCVRTLFPCFSWKLSINFLLLQKNIYRTFYYFLSTTFMNHLRSLQNLCRLLYLFASSYADTMICVYCRNLMSNQKITKFLFSIYESHGSPWGCIAMCSGLMAPCDCNRSDTLPFYSFTICVPRVARLNITSRKSNPWFSKEDQGFAVMIVFTLWSAWGSNPRPQH